MYAIFVTGGKQYRASEGDTIYVEKLANIGSVKFIESKDETSVAEIVDCIDYVSHYLNRTVSEGASNSGSALVQP